MQRAWDFAVLLINNKYPSSYVILKGPELERRQIPTSSEPLVLPRRFGIFRSKYQTKIGRIGRDVRLNFTECQI